jgi:uncharacterized protein
VEHHIQTNATLINDRHIPLFRKYSVSVGISVDGPDDLNDVRWAGSVELTRAATAKTHAAIERLVREGLTPSLIVTLHRNNATADKLPRMCDWFRYLDTLGITSVRLHDLEIESRDHAKYGLTGRADEGVLEFAARATASRVAIRCLLIFARCCSDRTTAPRVSGMPATRSIRGRPGHRGHGQRSNCGRTNKDGIDFVKPTVRVRTLPRLCRATGSRWLSRLPVLPDVQGAVSSGSINGDWRNRSSKCDLWMALFSLRGRAHRRRAARRCRSARRRALEAFALRQWTAGKSPISTRNCLV